MRGSARSQRRRQRAACARTGASGCRASRSATRRVRTNTGLCCRPAGERALASLDRALAVVRGSACQAAIASSENQTVRLPRWLRLASYSAQFVTRYRCLGIRCRRAALALNGTADVRQEGRSPPMSLGSGYQLAYSCNNAPISALRSSLPRIALSRHQPVHSCSKGVSCHPPIRYVGNCGFCRTARRVQWRRR